MPVALGKGTFETWVAGLSFTQPLSAAKRKKARRADKRRLMVAGGVCAMVSHRLKSSMLSLSIGRRADSGESRRGRSWAVWMVSENQEKKALMSLL